MVAGSCLGVLGRVVPFGQYHEQVGDADRAAISLKKTHNDSPQKTTYLITGLIIDLGLKEG
jgi:hypothetical protein